MIADEVLDEDGGGMMQVPYAPCRCPFRREVYPFRVCFEELDDASLLYKNDSLLRRFSGLDAAG